MAEREPLAPKADQPRITTKELGREEARGAGGTLQYKNVDVRVSPARQARKQTREINRT
jgi:hypothetical protein